MIKSLKSVLDNKDIRKKIIATLLLVLVYKLLSVIPVYWVNTTMLASIIEQNKGLSFFSALMWGWLSNFSIILMWLSPYINAMIIIQLLWVIVPKIWDLQKEWEQGQKKLIKMTRWLTLPLAFIQSYGMIVLLNTLAHWTIVDLSDTQTVLMSMVIITAWTIFLVWLWDVMTEVWIGNGISVIITAWVLAWVPSVISQHMSAWTYGLFAGLVIATLVVIYVIIKFTEWNRRIPVIYTRTWREEKSYFPIRVNQAWMVPIIFAISLITFPSIIWQIMSASTSDRASAIWKFLLEHFNMSNPSWAFIILYFLLVVWFSFFYVSITFNTENIAERLYSRNQTRKRNSKLLDKSISSLKLIWWLILSFNCCFAIHNDKNHVTNSWFHYFSIMSYHYCISYTWYS